MSVISSLTHHATLFVHPERKAFAEELWSELKTQSPAHVLYDQTVLDIETVRGLISWANAPYDGKKIALLSFHTIGLPAQNALLKIVEEPFPTVSFIFVTTNKEAIIPTLYSRLQHREISSTSSSLDNANLFLRTTSSERMKLPFIIQLLEARDEEDRKERENLRNFILTLTTVLTQYGEHASKALNTLEMASFAGDPSSSAKAILEYLSLLLPETKV
jgi:DNA polymerase III delta prime subunit